MSKQEKSFQMKRDGGLHAKKYTKREGIGMRTNIQSPIATSSLIMEKDVEMDVPLHVSLHFYIFPSLFVHLLAWHPYISLHS